MFVVSGFIVFVVTVDCVEVDIGVGPEHPLVGKVPVGRKLRIPGMNPTQRVDHLNQLIGAVLAFVGVQHIRIAIPRFGRQTPLFTVTIPTSYQSNGGFILFIFRFVLFPVVDIEHRDPSFRVQEPPGKPKTVVVLSLPIELL